MNTKITAVYALLQGSYIMIYGAFGAFASVYLLAQGFSNAEIGLCVSAGNLLAALIQPWLADLADCSKKITLVDILYYLDVTMILFLVVLLCLKGASKWVLLAYMVLFTLHGLLLPIVNSVHQYLTHAGKEVNFGLCRACGSASFALITIFTAYLVTSYGSSAILCLSLFCALILFLAIHLLQKNFTHKMVNKCKQDVSKETINLKAFVKRNKNFLLLNIGIMFLWYHHSTLSAFMFQLIAPIGGTQSQVGELFAIMAIVEVPAMIFYAYFEKKFGVVKMLLLAVMGYSLKITFFFFANNILLLYISQAMQAIGFAIFLPAMVSYTSKIMTKAEAVKGQSLFSMMMLIASIISSLTAGVILDVLSVRVLLCICLFSCYIGAYIISHQIRKINISN